METPIKICKFYKSAKDTTFCKDCGICIGYCELDQTECKKPLISIHSEKPGICLKHNKTEYELNELFSTLVLSNRGR